MITPIGPSKARSDRRAGEASFQVLDPGVLKTVALLNR